MRPVEIGKDMGSRSPVGRLFLVSVDFGKPVAHAAHAIRHGIPKSNTDFQSLRPISPTSRINRPLMDIQSRSALLTIGDGTWIAAVVTPSYLQFFPRTWTGRKSPLQRGEPGSEPGSFGAKPPQERASDYTLAQWMMPESAAVVVASFDRNAEAAAGVYSTPHAKYDDAVRAEGRRPIRMRRTWRAAACLGMPAILRARLLQLRG